MYIYCVHKKSARFPRRNMTNVPTARGIAKPAPIHRTGNKASFLSVISTRSDRNAIKMPIGYLKRNPKAKERRKFGLKKARKERPFRKR